MSRLHRGGALSFLTTPVRSTAPFFWRTDRIAGGTEKTLFVVMNDGRWEPIGRITADGEGDIFIIAQLIKTGLQKTPYNARIPIRVGVGEVGNPAPYKVF